MHKLLLIRSLPAILLLGMADGVPPSSPTKIPPPMREKGSRIEPHQFAIPAERASVMHYRYRKSG